MIETDRLLLRSWRDNDVDAMHAISSDPVVMEHFPRPSTWEETADLVVRHRGNLSWGRPGLYAVETLEQPGKLIGFVGLASPRFDAHFTPCVEVGWRLARSAWGHGYATEAGRAVLDWARTAGHQRLWATVWDWKTASRRVLAQLGFAEIERQETVHGTNCITTRRL